MKLDYLFEKSGCTFEDQNEATYNNARKADQNDEAHDIVDEQEKGGAVAYVVDTPSKQRQGL